MKIQEKHQYHGAALAQIVEFEGFTALNPAPDHKFGHYQINHDRELYVKYRTEHQEPGTNLMTTLTYRFTVGSDETAHYNNSFANNERTFLALVCGRFAVMLLSIYDLMKLLEIPSTKQQWIEVSTEVRKYCRVRGSKQTTNPLVIPHNSYPRNLFID